ncbi:MAG: nucleoside triphosphate pyrophosphohydrolase [Eggerthellaceae bacterium]|jgi:tetrapyrrole methylase family protein/MazG family protein
MELPETPGNISEAGAVDPSAERPDASIDAGSRSFAAFVATIARLRAPDGCPWDRAQTHESIAPNMLEEAYEAVDAIEAHDAPHLREELGDVLLQVVLQSQIASDAGEFDIDDVCSDINDKMVRRHPHIFGDAHADTPDEVEDLWSQVKLAEKNARAQSDEAAQTEGPSLLDAVPKSFPALMQAQKISHKAAAAGFEWDSVEDVWDQVRSEVAEFEAAQTPEDREMEFGDILFSLVNVARKEGIDAEAALRKANGKFRRRWAYIEAAAHEQGRTVEELSFDEMQRAWDAAKQAELLR